MDVLSLKEKMHIRSKELSVTTPEGTCHKKDKKKQAKRKSSKTNLIKIF